MDADLCKKCHESCQTCSTFGDILCSDCISGYKKMPDNTCKSCPDKKYFIENEFCKKCDDTCLTCKAYGIDQCIECETGKSFNSVR